jgi:hypothetical protein
MPRLDLDTLTCERQQDITGQDEIELEVNGVVVFERQMNKDDTVRCDYYLTFDPSCVIEVLERNGNRRKAIGPPQFVWGTEAGTGQRVREFTTSGARYVLSYEVTA